MVRKPAFVNENNTGACPSHGWGRRFDPCIAHQYDVTINTLFYKAFWSVIRQFRTTRRHPPTRHNSANIGRTRHSYTGKIRGQCSRDVHGGENQL